ncbi:MAG: MerR family transcriptional regulator [Sandarakinorhabdus sp.]|nr:MerR family transcriptional regulator [Sandarakinorhabdus sp.]
MAEAGRSTPTKDPAAFRTIREVSELLDVPQHVLRFWETRFPELKPLQRGGNRRYYRPADVAFATALHKLLHQDGYTVKGVRKLITDHGAANLVGIASGQPVAPRGTRAGRTVAQPTAVIAAAAAAALPPQAAVDAPVVREPSAGEDAVFGADAEPEPLIDRPAQPARQAAVHASGTSGIIAGSAIADLVRIRDRLAAALAN